MPSVPQLWTRESGVRSMPSASKALGRHHLHSTVFPPGMGGPSSQCFRDHAPHPHPSESVASSPISQPLGTSHKPRLLIWPAEYKVLGPLSTVTIETAPLPGRNISVCCWNTDAQRYQRMTLKTKLLCARGKRIRKGKKKNKCRDTIFIWLCVLCLGFIFILRQCYCGGRRLSSDCQGTCSIRVKLGNSRPCLPWDHALLDKKQDELTHVLPFGRQLTSVHWLSGAGIWSRRVPGPG